MFFCPNSKLLVELSGNKTLLLNNGGDSFNSSNGGNSYSTDLDQFKAKQNNPRVVLLSVRKRTTTPDVIIFKVI